MTKCLLVSPRFPEFSYWNYREVCALFGACYPAAPLGLATAAALLPQEWEIRLLDLNVREMDKALLDWADIVMAGGMIPQQRALRSLIDLCHARGKRIVVGGQDPTSQPDVYAEADYLVLDEGEMTIPKVPCRSADRRHARDLPLGREARCDPEPDAAVRPAGVAEVPPRRDSILPRLPAQLRVLRHHRAVRPETPDQNAAAASARAGLPLSAWLPWARGLRG